MKNPRNLLTKLPEQYHCYTYVKITLIIKKKPIQTAYVHVTQPFVLTQHSSNLLAHRFFIYGTPVLSHADTAPSSRMEYFQEIDYCTDSPAFAAELAGTPHRLTQARTECMCSLQKGQYFIYLVLDRERKGPKSDLEREHFSWKQTVAS